MVHIAHLSETHFYKTSPYLLKLVPFTQGYFVTKSQIFLDNKGRIILNSPPNLLYTLYLPEGPLSLKFEVDCLVLKCGGGVTVAVYADLYQKNTDQCIKTSS